MKKKEVSAMYFKERGYWIIFVHEGEKLLATSGICPSSSSDFQKELERTAEKLKGRGITREMIEGAMLQAVQEYKFITPRYLEA